MSRYKELFKDNGKLDYKFRDDLNANFTKSDSELTRIEGKVDTNNSDVNERVTQVEQDRIDRDNELDAKIDTKESESIQRDDDLDGRIDNIIAQSGTSDTEVVDARLGSDGVTYTVLKDRLDAMHEPLIEQEEQTAELQHGTSVIQSDQGGPLKVEFYGKSRINYMGREGSFHNQGKWASSLVVDTSTYKFGTSSGKIDNISGTTYKFSSNSTKLKISGKYVLLGAWIKSDSGTPNTKVRLFEYDSNDTFINSYDVSSTVDSNWSFYYGKFDLTSATGDYFNVRTHIDTYGTADDVVNFDGLLVEELTQEQYDAIGVSKTDEDVLREHNYIESVQHVENPVLSVSGSNLIPDKVLDIGWYYTSVTVDTKYRMKKVKVVPNTTVTISKDNPDFVYRVRGVQTETDLIGMWDTKSFVTFNTENNKEVYVSVRREDSTDLGNDMITVNDIGLMLNLGSSSKPFVEPNPSYLYAEVTLAGNENKKDILYYNESLQNPRWEVKREFDPKFVLDGSLPWEYRDYTNGDYATAYLKNAFEYRKNAGSDKEFVTEKDDGSIVESFPQITSASDDITEDREYATLYAGGVDDYVLYVNIPKSELATLDDAGVQDYFSNKNYFLSYQLAEPQTLTEGVDFPHVEGSLSIEGDAQVTVNSGGEFFESLSPDSTGKATLAHSASEVFGVFDGTAYVDFTVVDADNVQITNYDDTKSYTANYIRQDKYDFTTNLNDVRAHYNQSLKSSFESVVTKQSNIATEVSVHARQIYEMMLDIKALKGGA